MLSSVVTRLLVAVIATTIARGVVIAFGLDVAAANLIQSTIAYFPSPEAVSWIISGLIGAIALLLWMFLRADDRLHDLFQARRLSAEITTTLVIQGTGPVGVFTAITQNKPGLMATPVGFLLNIKVTNHEHTPTKVESFSVAAAHFQSGPWTSLSNIELTTSRIFYVRDGLRRAHPLEFSRLDVALQRQVEARNSVAGWAAFERIDQNPDFFRVILRDSAGKTKTTVCPAKPRSVDGETAVRMASLRVLPDDVDLSSVRFG